MHSEMLLWQLGKMPSPLISYTIRAEVWKCSSLKENNSQSSVFSIPWERYLCIYRKHAFSCRDTNQLWKWKKEHPWGSVHGNTEQWRGHGSQMAVGIAFPLAGQSYAQSAVHKHLINFTIWFSQLFSFPLSSVFRKEFTDHATRV